jgi:hypothetical protein
MCLEENVVVVVMGGERERRSKVLKMRYSICTRSECKPPHSCELTPQDRDKHRRVTSCVS